MYQTCSCLYLSAVLMYWLALCCDKLYTIRWYHSAAEHCEFFIMRLTCLPGMRTLFLAVCIACTSSGYVSLEVYAYVCTLPCFEMLVSVVFSQDCSMLVLGCHIWQFQQYVQY